MEKLFKIYKLEQSEINKILELPDNPHKHDFEELIIGVKGKLEHFIDYNSKIIQAPFVSFVTKGKIHRVIPGTHNDECIIWVIRFKTELIAEAIFQLYSNYHDHANVELEEGDCFRRMVSVCELMEDEYLHEIPNYSNIKQLLTVLFTMVEVERKKKGKSTDYFKTQNVVFKNFLSLLEENYQRPEGVEFYAEKLFMTSRNLNLICHNNLEQSVSEIIQTRKLIEAKNLLITTNKTIAEIGYEIGYNEKSYFSNVFKKKTGQTPSKFREYIKTQLIS